VARQENLEVVKPGNCVFYKSNKSSGVSAPVQDEILSACGLGTGARSLASHSSGSQEFQPGPAGKNDGHRTERNCFEKLRPRAANVAERRRQ
jgi:hypothetical protein